MDVAGLLALAATVLGLVAVLVEIGYKSLSAFLEIAMDSESFARSTPPATSAVGEAAAGDFQALAYPYSA